MSDAEKNLLTDFKAALARYQERRKACINASPQDGAFFCSQTWHRNENLRSAAAEELWVTGLAGFFDLLTTNHEAQAKLVAKQLDLAQEQTASARRTARWTIVMALVAAATIIGNALGPKPWRDPPPTTPQVIYVQAPPFQASSIDAGATLADAQSPQLPSVRSPH